MEMLIDLFLQKVQRKGHSKKWRQKSDRISVRTYIDKLKTIPQLTIFWTHGTVRMQFENKKYAKLRHHPSS